jgi:hypothetical protein
MRTTLIAGILIGSLSLISALTLAEEDCVSPVEAADSMNPNLKVCDYGDKGLNAYLRKAFRKDNEAVPAKESAGNVAAVSGSVLTLSTEVDQWANVALAKNQLLPKIMERCDKGFLLTGESYRALAMGRIELTLNYSCL